MKLSQYAKKIGVGYQTAWLWFKSGKIDGALNILRKEVPNTLSGYGIEVCSTPVVLTMK